MRSVRKYGERGAITVWTAVVLIGFIVIIGIGVDFSGHARATQEARGIAAEAARAGQQHLGLTDGRLSPEPDVAKKGGRELRGGVPIPWHCPNDRRHCHRGQSDGRIHLYVPEHHRNQNPSGQGRRNLQTTFLLENLTQRPTDSRPQRFVHGRSSSDSFNRFSRGRVSSRVCCGWWGRAPARLGCRSGSETAMVRAYCVVSR